jgi:uncharacterized protein
MRKIFVGLLIGVTSIGTLPVLSQQVPPAVVSDPAPDAKFPASLAPLTIPSHGVDLDATFYLAAGSGPHGTVLLLHGLPGYEQNADLAQSIRRAGWNVLIFHYRGLWGQGGSFSNTAAIEDTAEAVRFLRDPANVAKYRIDPKRLLVIGHSAGGFLAGYEASHDKEITAVAMISPVNLGTINGNPSERATRIKRWESQFHPVRGATPAELFDEAARHSKDWDYVQWADALCCTRPVLLVEADDQNHADMEALAAALRQKKAAALEQKALPTDHSFSDHRIALQTIVIDWLQKLQ